ncbi:MAG: hypothetical protein LBH44_07610 [Treponema sp.]|jgi:uncharacterized protein with von Willebrand factor type A (vWA) domain|nr:hypothetical protein [Treponema sp.]
MENKMERLRLWVEAAAEDMRDVEELCEIAGKMKTHGDDSDARKFAARAKKHLEYLEEDEREIEELVCELDKEGLAQHGVHSVKVKIMEEEQDRRIAKLKAHLDAL